MVRSIKSCSSCGFRFVSHGAGKKKKKIDLCSSCRSRTEPQDNKENNCNTLSLNGSKHLSSSTRSTRDDSVDEDFLLVDHRSSCDSQDSDSCAAGSEGGDDFYCTQIIESQDTFDQDENAEATAAQNHGDVERHSKRAERLVLSNDDPLPKPNPEAATCVAATKATTTSSLSSVVSSNNSNSDICFICGADLSKLKRRIDHIKRCSKKHGITGRDVRLEHSANSATESPMGNGNAKSANNNSLTNWHGDAQELLKLTKQTIPSVNLANNSPSALPPKASSASSWKALGYNAKSGKFAAPSATRNLNNVLMAGSRRLEVDARAAQKRGEIQTNNDSNTRKRSRYSNWNCPMYKKITGTDFVVDGFHYAKHSLTKNYFLTHFHSDHYGGILSSWDVGTIYCSLPTASLVSQQLRVDKRHIHPLPMNTPTVIESRGKAVTVTLLDANHCPGAVMFLFEVGKRTILHVGDFRWSKEAMLLQNDVSPLHKIVSQTIGLDELYLDTTYCDEKYQLPPQSATIQATIETFGKELERCQKASPKRTLHLFGAYTIGKEKMYLSVAKHFGLKVYVDKSRLKILSTLNLPEEYTKLLTTNKELSDIWVVPMGHLNMKKMPDYFKICNSKPFAQAYDRIVGYRPTGWSLSRSGIVSSRSSGKVAIHSVPYSEHSSFPELIDCLECLKPAKIIPTVNASKSNEQIKLLLTGLRNKQAALKMFSSKKPP